MTFNTNLFETFLTFGKDNADALSKSSAATVKAFESIAREQQAVLTRSVDKADAAIKALLTVKSSAEMTELQTRLARQSIEDAISDTRRLTEVATSAVTAALEPLNARLGAFQGGFGKTA